MKLIDRFRILFLFILFLTVNVCLAAGDIVLTGNVKDRSNRKQLESVSVSVAGSNIGTVTNKEGFFSLTLPDSVKANSIKIEHLGYHSALVRVEKLTDEKPYTIWLTPSAKLLGEVTIYGADPRSLIETALAKIPVNYPNVNNLFSSFYRETIQKGKRYIDVSEAIVKVQKSPYKQRTISGERVQVDKGRRLMSQNAKDTLAVKIAGGPTLPILLDMVKNPNLLFSNEELDYYAFSLEPMTFLDDRPQFSVRFTPIAKVDYPLHKGVVYIDMETLSFTRAEFSMDMSDKDKATRAILYKKPRGLRFKPQELEFVVSYKQQDGKTYLNYVRTITRFKCDWKRRLFSSGYTVCAEMVMVDRNDNPSGSIQRKEAFGTREVFSDMVENFQDPDFWKGYTIIEPTESLEKAVDKLSKVKQ